MLASLAGSEVLAVVNVTKPVGASPGASVKFITEGKTLLVATDTEARISECALLAPPCRWNIVTAHVLIRYQFSRNRTVATTSSGQTPWGDKNPFGPGTRTQHS
eukprot:scaffold9680_cov15-Prasinocladus_malaysianus.AAC.1